MAGFFDRILKKKEPEVRHLNLDEVTGFLDESEADAYAVIEAAAKKARSTAEEVKKDIAGTLKELEEKGPDDIKHPNPRLRQTAMNSRKSFIASMEKTLSSELPEDPDLLYSGLAEMIKSMSNSMKRQGKYLHPAFPEEMAEIKSSLGEIGRELNSMTEELKEPVRLREKVHGARDRFGKIRSASAELSGIDKETASLEERISEMNTTLEAKIAEKKLLIDSGEYFEYESVVKEISSLKEEKDEISSKYGGLLVASDNVLRKTAYIAEKAGDAKVSERLNYLAVLLHSGGKKDSKDAIHIYRELYPYIEKTIGENDTLLKNKHEVSLFSSCDSFVSQLEEICGAYSVVLSEIESAEERISFLPVMENIDILGEKARHLEEEIEKAEDNLRMLAERKDNLEEKTPVLFDEMQDLLSEIEDGPVVVKGDWKEDL